MKYVGIWYAKSIESKLDEGASNALSKIIGFEKSIMNEALEHGQFISKEGELIGETIVGTETSINLSAYKELAKDTIFTHNHPSNGVFSLEDLETAAGFNMAEIRAVCPNGTTYSITRGVEGWTPKTFNELKDIDAVAKIEIKNDPLFQKLLQEGNTNAINDMLFEKLAKVIGGEYKVIR